MTSLHEPTGIREFTDGVTFRAFRQLAARRGWTADQVLALLAARGAETFGGPRASPYYETPRAYLARLLRRGHVVDDDQVIPYRGLLALYVETLARDGRLAPGETACACGCGRAVHGRHRYASAACRKRASRQRLLSAVRDPLDPPENPHAQQGLFCDISANPVSGYPCHTLLAQLGSDAVAADRRAHAGASLSLPPPG